MGWDGIRTYWPPLLYVTQWHAPGDDAQLVDCKDVEWVIKLKPYHCVLSEWLLCLWGRPFSLETWMPMRHVQVECEDHESGMTNRSYPGEVWCKMRVMQGIGWSLHICSSTP